MAPNYICNGSGELVIGVADCMTCLLTHLKIQLTTIPCTYRSLSSELLNCKITDILVKMTHQESNINLDDLLKQ